MSRKEADAKTRRTQIAKMSKAGLTQSEIGRKLGIGRERVRQILNGRSSKKERLSDLDTPLSTGDVARLLNIHPNTVRRWSSRGILKTYRVGPRGDRRFRRADVETLIEENT